MSIEKISENEIPINVVGLDVGGTKSNAMNSEDTDITRYETANFNSPYELIDSYLEGLKNYPNVICLGIAAACNSLDGNVRLVKRDWPTFKPDEASDLYGAKVVTANDMITTAIGIFEGDSDIKPLKKGHPSEFDPTLVYAWSTGIGASLVVKSEQNVYLPSAVGHSGLAPQHEDEIDYLRFISSQHKGKLSLEFALAGEFGVDNLIKYYTVKEPEAIVGLNALIAKSKTSKKPTGQILIDAALSEGTETKAISQRILNRLGGLMGYTLRNQVLAVQVGDVKMTGSVAKAMMPYLAEHTSFIERFIDKDARCAYIPESISIDLVEDPDVAVKGALLLATKEI